VQAMSKLEEVQRVLNNRFKVENRELKENDFQIPIEKKKCNYILYKYDDPSTLKGLAGGLLPFFNESEGVKKMPDYIMFIENGQKFYALIFELKEKKEFPIAQIKAGRAFINFVVETINRTGESNVNPQIRGLGISRFNAKRTTKLKDVTYDRSDYCEYTYKTINVDLLLN
jgi:hypothetical protein